MVKFRLPDRLSHLPDDVLHHLLSFLDFVDVVRTSVLSKRWRNVWCSVPCLNFNYVNPVEKDHDDWDEMEEDDHGRTHHHHHQYDHWNFITSALLLRCGSSQIKRLSAVVNNPQPEELDLLLRVAAKHRVEELFLRDIGTYVDSLYFQRQLCEALSVLKLDFRFEVSLEPRACLTSLKSLYLRKVNMSGDAVHKLFSSDCVKLESVHLEEIEITGTDAVEISAPNLKNLNIVNAYDNIYSSGSSNLKTALVISASKLLSFTYIGPLLPDLDLRDAVSLEDGVIRILEHNHLFPSPGTFVGFYHARVLTLNTVAVKYFSPGYGQFLCSVVKFYNLSCLKLEIRCNAAHIEGLVNLLKISPNLESLFITIQEGKRYYFEDFSQPQQRTKVIHRGRPWKSREEYIPCLAHLMNFIQISYFDGSRIALELIKFFLHNGKVLRKMEILHWNKDRKENSTKKVLSLLPASPEIVVSFPNEYALKKLPYFDLGESDDAADIQDYD